MWFKKLYVGTIDLLSAIVEKIAKCNLACKIYKAVFQLGVFPKPKNFDKIVSNLVIEKDIAYESSILEGNKLDVYYPKNLNKKAPILMWIHGGGYIANSKETVKNYMMTLANKGFVVFNIDYALAPKYKYPSQILQCNKMNLKPSITNKFLRGVILFCGLYNMDSLRATKFPGIKTYMEALTGESNFENYERIDELATIKYITPNYPSTFITVGDIDPFVDQGKELASSLRALGVKVVSRFFENKGLWHEYQFKFSVKEARETFKSVIEFLNDNSKSMN